MKTGKLLHFYYSWTVFFHYYCKPMCKLLFNSFNYQHKHDKSKEIELI